MKSLLRKKNICVLATVSGGRPHCSLMAYTTDAHCRKIYMYTRRNTRKHANLTENRAVSILIDSRGESDRRETLALTVAGEFEPVEDPQSKKRIQQDFLCAHPHLTELVDHCEAELVCIRIDSFLLLDGPDKADYAEVHGRER